MEEVKCTQNGKPYTIWQFNQLTDSQREQFRKHLICIKCGASAYYRKESRDGKAACFGARPHNAGCSVATSTPTNDEQHDINDVSIITTSGDSIRINFNSTSPEVDSDQSKDNTQYHSGRHSNPSKRHVNDPAQHRIASRGLKTLLNYLMYVPSFAQSETIIYTDRDFYRRAKNLFVKFEDAQPDNKPYLFWGMISDADNKLTWLNTGGKESVSIPISDIRKTLIEIPGINDPEYFAGAYAIVFGWCKKSNKGKLAIQIKDKNPNYIFIKN